MEALQINFIKLWAEVERVGDGSEDDAFITVVAHAHLLSPPTLRKVLFSKWGRNGKKSVPHSTPFITHQTLVFWLGLVCLRQVIRFVHLQKGSK